MFSVFTMAIRGFPIYLFKRCIVLYSMKVKEFPGLLVVFGVHFILGGIAYHFSYRLQNSTDEYFACLCSNSDVNKSYNS